VLAAIVAWIWLGEELAAVQIVGGLIVLIGVLLAQTSRGEDRAERRDEPGKTVEPVAACASCRDA
jgi:drug/metabolite transporter (DMT)-like permease